MPVWEKQEREFISDMEIREGFLISLKIQDHEPQVTRESHEREMISLHKGEQLMLQVIILQRSFHTQDRPTPAFGNKQLFIKGTKDTSGASFK